MKRKKFAVIGLGKFGFHVARSLYEAGHEVVAMDSEKSRVQAIDPYSSEAFLLDATDREAVRALGLEHMDGVLVSTGTTISASLLICLHLKEMGVENILAKALDDDHAEILRRVGVTEVIHPERDTARRVARSLSTPNLIEFLPLAEGFEMVRIVASGDIVGKSLKEIDMRAQYQVHVVAIKAADRDELTLVPSADYRIGEGDILMVLGESADISRMKLLR